MGLRSRLRRLLFRHGYPVPDALAPVRERLLYATLRGVRPGMVVVDIGAHRGETAVAFALRGARVHAFEPNPDIFPELLEAVRRQPRILPEQCAVLDGDGEMRLHLHQNYAVDPRRHSESSSLLAEKPGMAAGDFRLVPVRDVAGVVRGIGRIDIMKIDAEGAEYRILRRLIESGAIDAVGRVMVETHEDRIPTLRPEHEAIVALIAERGLAGRIRLDWM